MEENTAFQKEPGAGLAKRDRRRRNLSRADPRDRRTFARYASSFPVTVRFPAPDGLSREVPATTKDVSAGGLFLENVDLPADATTVTIEFRVPDGGMPEEYLHGSQQVKAVIRYRDPARRRFGVEFEETLIQRLARTTWRRMKWGAVIGFLIATSSILFLKYDNLYFFWFDVPVFLYSLLVSVYLLSRFVFAAFYRQAKPVATLPRITVIAPIFNEEKHAERTIAHVMEAAYPADLLQFVVIDDGSTDNTAGAIEAARAKYPEVELISFEKSRGKREALAAGASRATGDILVFIDSDSFLDPNALRNIVSPFADPEIAAVTGHCEVDNAWTNVLTRTQAVRYHIAFRVMKAAESVFDSVTCLSGPLAAYRRSVFAEVRDEWLGQKFFGQVATFGDDRSLTNSLLRRGCKVVYQSDALTTTIVPEDHGTFLRQQMRWKRAWFRESVRGACFMWRKPPLMSLSFYLGFLLPLLGPLVVLRALLYVPLTQHRSPLMYITGVFLMSALMSATYLFIKRSRLWYYGILFSFYYMFVLIWQLPWAILTCARPLWGTRK